MLHTKQCHEPGTCGERGPRDVPPREAAAHQEKSIPFQPYALQCVRFFQTRVAKRQVEGRGWESGENRNLVQELRDQETRIFIHCQRLARQAHQQKGEPGRRSDQRTKCAVSKTSWKLIEARRACWEEGSTGTSVTSTRGVRLCPARLPEVPFVAKAS